MRLEIKCFASLACHAPQSGFLDMPEASSVQNVMHTLAMQPEDVKIIFINGIHAAPESLLKDGDRLGLVPAVGGG